MERFPQVGGQLGRFKLERKLGEGSTGTVFLAHDGLLKTRVALRVLNPRLAQGEAFERISRPGWPTKSPRPSARRMKKRRFTAD